MGILAQFWKFVGGLEDFQIKGGDSISGFQNF